MDRSTYLHELRRQSEDDKGTRYGSGPHNRRPVGVTIQDLRKRARRRAWSRMLWEWAHERGWERS